MSAQREVSFDWDRPPLTANQRLHWAVKARTTSEVRSAAAREFAFFTPTTRRVEVTLTWYVKDKRRRDVDNIVPTLKALCDGLVDAGVVPDDTPEFMVKNMPVIAYVAGCEPCLVLKVSEVGDVDGR